MRLVSLSLAVLLCFGLSGCTFGRKPTVSVPVAPAPVGLPAPLPTATPVRPEGAHPLPVLEAPEAPPPEPLPPVSRTLPPPQPTLAEPGRRPAPAAPEPTPPPQAETPPLRLGAILSPEREQQYQTELNQSLTAAKAATSQAGTAALTSGQRETVARIQTFIEQAEEMAQTDLATAVQIARRAQLLGQELTRALR